MQCTAFFLRLSLLYKHPRPTSFLFLPEADGHRLRKIQKILFFLFEKPLFYSKTSPNSGFTKAAVICCFCKALFLPIPLFLFIFPASYCNMWIFPYADINGTNTRHLLKFGTSLGSKAIRFQPKTIFSYPSRIRSYGVKLKTISSMKLDSHLRIIHKTFFKPPINALFLLLRQMRSKKTALSMRNGKIHQQAICR